MIAKHKRPSFGKAACILSSDQLGLRPAIFKKAVSTRHAGVEKRPALSAVEMFFSGLLLAIRPPCLVLGPLLLCGIPLLLGPGFGARRSGCRRGRWGSRLRFGGCG